jgi:hypothetical protein
VGINISKEHTVFNFKAEVSSVPTNRPNNGTTNKPNNQLTDQPTKKLTKDEVM